MENNKTDGRKVDRKLTDEQVRKIKVKYRLRADVSVRTLAAEYNVSKTLIHKIVTNRLYKDVTA